MSCGCFRKEQANKAMSPGLAGQTFGELTVVCEAVGHKKRGTYWVCRCSCGAEYITAGTLLITGRRTRCPAQCHEKNYAFSDITGQRFGRLTAQYRVKDQTKYGSVMWHCSCDCGNEMDLTYNTLIYSTQKSCGCLRNEHGQQLYKMLTHQGGTSLEAVRSRKIPKDNTTGYRGVYRIRGKYMAKIVFQKKQYFLGTYEKLEEAAEARKEAEEILFDQSATYLAKWKQLTETDPEWAKGNPVRIAVSRTAENHLSISFTPDLSGR